MKRFVFLWVLMLALIPATSLAMDATSLEMNLPRKYEGTFRWVGDSIVDNFEMFLDQTSIGEDLVVAQGKGQYNRWGKITSIDVLLEIHPSTMTFEMFELNPSSGDFITEGSHKGTISQDLKTINGTWTSRADGDTGNLQLQAVD